jgi:DNA-binding NtrC family response regulator
MAMKKAVPAASPDAYVAALSGWRRKLVTTLRTAVRGAARLEEAVKWGHLVYSFERRQIEAALAAEGGHTTRVAARLGLERSHLYKKLKQLGLRPDE